MGQVAGRSASRRFCSKLFGNFDRLKGFRMIETGKLLQQRYRIDKQIGLGGMGAVYVATDERFGSIVAIKETLFMDDNYRKAIEREARLLNSLKHAALPRVSDHFLEENGQFIVMEFIPGEDLGHILEETGQPFRIADVITWADQLLDALEYLHTQSMPVIHRDIKPQNLKLNAQGQIILLDFGLAKGNPTDAAGHTGAKSIFGYSRNYASLEQIQGTGTDPRSDLYSLAATLYHLATGQAPEDALTRAMAVLSQQPDPLVPAHSLRSDIPAGFSAILHNALDLNASSRPASAHEMREMIRRMDDYAHLAPEIGGAATNAGTHFGSEKTKLMPGVTSPGYARFEGAKTEVLPSYVSEETAVRQVRSTGSEPAAPKTRRRAVFAAASLMLLIAGLAAGAYILDPALFDHQTERGTEQQNLTDQPAVVQPEVPPASNIVSPDPAGRAEAATEPQKNVAARQESVRPPSAEPVRAAKKTAADNTADNFDLKIDDPELKGKTIYLGNIKIKDGKVETPELIIDEKGFTPKTPPVAPVGPAEPDMRHLTPAERRKIQILRRRGVLPPVRRDRPAANKQ